MLHTRQRWTRVDLTTRSGGKPQGDARLDKTKTDVCVRSAGVVLAPTLRVL